MVAKECDDIAVLLATTEPRLNPIRTGLKSADGVPCQYTVVDDDEEEEDHNNNNDDDDDDNQQKGANRDFYNPLTAPRTVSNT